MGFLGDFWSDLCGVLYRDARENREYHARLDFIKDLTGKDFYDLSLREKEEAMEGLRASALWKSHTPRVSPEPYCGPFISEEEFARLRAATTKAIDRLPPLDRGGVQRNY